jgi:hypothetical protein
MRRADHSRAYQAHPARFISYLTRRGTPGVVKLTLERFYQVHYRITEPLPMVSIVICSAFARNLLPRCISSILIDSSCPNLGILLAVNEIAFPFPIEKTILILLNATRIRVLTYQDNSLFNYSAINNWAVRHSNGPIVCLMNDDVEIITPDWLEKLVARAQLLG